MRSEESKKKQAAYKLQYEKDNTKRVNLKFNKVHDEDILSHLSFVDNVNGYIKKLIREDMAKNAPESF